MDSSLVTSSSWIPKFALDAMVTSLSTTSSKSNGATGVGFRLGVVVVERRRLDSSVPTTLTSTEQQMSVGAGRGWPILPIANIKPSTRGFGARQKRVSGKPVDFASLFMAYATKITSRCVERNVEDVEFARPSLFVVCTSIIAMTAGAFESSYATDAIKGWARSMTMLLSSALRLTILKSTNTSWEPC